MNGLTRALNRRSFRRATLNRPCPDCQGRGRWSRPALAPDGTVPVRRVMLRIECSTCKGKGSFVVADEVHEKERVRIYGPDGKLVLDAPDLPPET